MSNRIVKDKVTINGNLSVNGQIYLVKNEKCLNQIDNIDNFELLSGDFDNLSINGDLVVCEYDKNCDMVVNGEVVSNGNQLLE